MLFQTRILAAAWARVPRAAWAMTRAGGGCWWIMASPCVTRACSPGQRVSHVSRVPAPPARSGQQPARVTCPEPGDSPGGTGRRGTRGDQPLSTWTTPRCQVRRGQELTGNLLTCPCLALLQSQAMRSLQHHENNKLRSIWVLGSKKRFLFRL